MSPPPRTGVYQCDLWFRGRRVSLSEFQRPVARTIRFRTLFYRDRKRVLLSGANVVQVACKPSYGARAVYATAVHDGKAKRQKAKKDFGGRRRQGFPRTGVYATKLIDARLGGRGRRWELRKQFTANGIEF